MSVTGSVWKYGNDINTDLIYPGRYTYLLLTEEEMASHALEGLDPEFSARDVQGNILAVGKNFGCGSAREQAVQCLKAKKIAVIIAKSFSRIFFRNCINEGLLPVICPEAVDAVETGDVITVDTDLSCITTPAGTFYFGVLPNYLKELLDAGGLIAVTKQEVAHKATENPRR